MCERGNPESSDNEQHGLGHLLRDVCRLSGGRLRRRMEAVGLHGGQGLVLFHLWHHDGSAVSEIARALYISPATVTNMLKRMERDGWVERRRDPTDERIVRAYLTPRAAAWHDEGHREFRAFEAEIASAFTPEELGELRRLLEHLRDRLESDAAPTGTGEGG